jgi:hypothetical protein
MIIHSLNNIPENVYELPAKRLLAWGAAVLLLGGGIGWVIAEKNINRQVVAQQLAMEKPARELPPAPPATAAVLLEKWKYPDAQECTSDNGETVLSLLTTPHSPKRVHDFYNIKFQSEEFFPRPLSPVESIQPQASGTFITRGAIGDINSQCLTRQTNDHNFEVMIQPKGSGTQITLHITRLRK